MPEPLHKVRWYTLNVNPEPWAVGPLDVIRRGGRLMPTYGQNQQLAAYKRAIREELESNYPDDLTAILPPKYIIDFFFWRNRADYSTPAQRTARKHDADATNMQKATEDALQGILIGNDADVVKVSSMIVAQGPDVAGGVVIRIQWGVDLDMEIEMFRQLPQAVQQEILTFKANPPTPSVSDNLWPPR